MQKFDAIIIGSGQAANPLAHNLADKDWKVALIEREHLGGSCINYGCTPTKTMIASAQIAHNARIAPKFGVDTGDVSVDLHKIVALKNKIVNDWRAGQENHVSSRRNITLFRHEASFTGPHTVRAGDEELTSERVFINTGSHPRTPPIDDIDTVPYLTNRNIIDLEEAPEHLIVAGGSYVGLEFGQMFRRFGSRVTVVEMANQIAPKEDPDVSEELQKALAAEGIEFYLNCEVTSVEGGTDGSVTIHHKLRDSDKVQQITGSHLLLASGRIPNSEALNLEAAGIAHERGWITVNEYLETSVPGVYALGDVNGGPAFTHASYNDFLIVFHNLFHDEKRSTAGRIIPYALFTDPELGRVGLTEKAAREAGHKIKVGSIPMAWVARAIERQETAGLMKVVVDAETDKLLGATILGAGGGELAQSLMFLMMADQPYTVLYQAPFTHPTLIEGFFTLFDNVK